MHVVNKQSWCIRTIVNIEVAPAGLQDDLLRNFQTEQSCNFIIQIDDATSGVSEDGDQQLWRQQSLEFASVNGIYPIRGL